MPSHSALNRLKRAASSVSTRPPSSAYVWGGRRSVLATVAFFGIYWVRLVSPLQWIKHLVRRKAAKRTTTNLRPDFPATYTEVYFLCVTAILLVLLVADISDVWGPLEVVARVAGWALLIESVGWFGYYVLLRGFVERKFTIFHPAEYLLMFPVIVVEQLLLLALLTDGSFGTYTSYLIGNVSSSDPLSLVVGVAGLVYLGAGISVLLTTHPGIQPRATQTVGIIGAGQVVGKHILPALHWLGYETNDITVSSTEISDREVIAPLAKTQVGDESEVIKKVLQEGGATIIASPTAAHFRQLVQLANQTAPFAVEKPIAAASAEVQVLRDQGDSIMKNGFALSYYSLEKALPLTYLFRPLPQYRRFLDVHSTDVIREVDLAGIVDALGPLLSAEVKILEGVGRSPSGHSRLWTELPNSAHTLVETAIHPMLLLRRVLKSNEAPIWSEVAVMTYAPRRAEVLASLGSEIAPTFIKAKGDRGATSVSFSVGKYMPEPLTQRTALFRYERGEIACDFDTRALTVSFNDSAETFVVAVKESYPDYAVQLSLFMDFATNGWGATRFDDFLLQLDALDWWGLCSRFAEEPGSPLVEYDDASPQQAFGL